MGVRLAGGWTIEHLTDRMIEIRKESLVFRQLTGRDGYVRVLGEAGIDRATMLDRAMQAAERQDRKADEFIATQIIPRNLRGYVMTAHGLGRACRTGEEPESIGRKRVTA